mmetsp:Transcript_10941/g.14769  ORF Transcript_10941/g.14769 Transcript_10941/m.14769 type:complete len:291 (-) Transcript_10941:386-1258(-)
MLALELTLENEVPVGVVEELCGRISVIVAVHACKFLVVGRVGSHAVDHCLRGCLLACGRPSHLLELVASGVRNEFLVSSHVGKLCEIARETRLHGHVLSGRVDLAHVALGGGLALLRQLLLVKDWLPNVVELHGPIQAVDQTKLEVWGVHAREHDRRVRLIEDWVLGVEVRWQALNLVKSVLLQIKHENLRIFLVDEHLTEIAIQKKLLVLIMLLLLVLFRLLISRSFLLFFLLVGLLGIPIVFIRRRLGFLTNEADFGLVRCPSNAAKDHIIVHLGDLLGHFESAAERL